jgi:hypothetical protein
MQYAKTIPPPLVDLSRTSRSDLKSLNPATSLSIDPSLRRTWKLICALETSYPAYCHIHLAFNCPIFPSQPATTANHQISLACKDGLFGGFIGMRKTFCSNVYVRIHPIEYKVPSFGPSIHSLLCRARCLVRTTISPIRLGLKGRLLSSSYTSDVLLMCIGSCNYIL